MRPTTTFLRTQIRTFAKKKPQQSAWKQARAEQHAREAYDKNIGENAEAGRVKDTFG